MMNGLAVINTVLLGIIALLFSLVAKMVLAQMRDFHREAMVHLDDLRKSVGTVADKIDEHLRDHATGAFKVL